MASTVAAQIQQFYNAFFGRPADPSGIRFWTTGVNASGDLIGTAIKMFGDPAIPEFALRYPAGTSVASFLDIAYANMFNRSPDEGGRVFWTNAFNNWVGGGKSEGEARALILQNFMVAANAQVGTEDKLTITNKQTVADVMTASVKAYGTEAAYIAGLDKAQDLLAGVDHTQASVDKALARIKNGYVDGIDPVTGMATVTPRVVDLVYAPGVNLHWAWVGKNEVVRYPEPAVLKIDKPSDSAFGWIYTKFLEDGTFVTGEVMGPNTVGGTANWAAVFVNDFNAKADKIDLTSFRMDQATSKVASTFLPLSYFSGTFDVSTGISTPSANFRVLDGFFEGASVLLMDAPNTRWETQVFVDTNGNNNLDPGIDLMIRLSEVHFSHLTEANFIM